MSDKKKFKDTKVGGWLKTNAPNILHKVLDTADNAIPALGFLTDLINVEPSLTLEQKAEGLKVSIETYEKELDYDLQQTAGARGIYGGPSKDMTDWIAKQVFTWNMPYVLMLVVGNVVCALYLESGILALFSNVIGIIIGRLLEERSNASQFYLGSSIGSKLKDIFKPKT